MRARRELARFDSSLAPSTDPTNPRGGAHALGVASGTTGAQARKHAVTVARTARSNLAIVLPVAALTLREIRSVSTSHV